MTKTDFKPVSKILAIFILFSFFFCAGSEVQAQSAALYLTPSAGSYTVGNNFSIYVKVNTGGISVNATQGSLVFDPNKLEVVGLSKGGSIFSLWTKEPSYSNVTGEISFGGGVPTPGYSGSSGTILTITLKGKTAGETSISFSGGAVLANDGKGTNILSSLGLGNYTLQPITLIPTPGETTTPAPSTGVPIAPKVTSSTHPDPDKWYASKNPEFEWYNSGGTTGVNIVADRNPITNPGTRSDGVFRKYSYQDVDEGIWYFHIRLLNSAGWGSVAHFRFMVDSESPDFFKAEVLEDEIIASKVPIKFEARDKVSGIDHFLIIIDGDDEIVWTDDGHGIFITPPQVPGSHTAAVKAVDKAGNFRSDIVEFEISALRAPNIIDYPPKLYPDDILIIKGSTEYLNSEAIIFLQSEGAEIIRGAADVQADGIFTFVLDEKLPEGLYKMWAIIETFEGSKSASTKKYVIAVQKPALLRIGGLIINYLTIVITLLALIFLLLFGYWYAWHKFKKFKSKLTKEVKEAETELHKTFDSLKEEVGEQLKLLDKVKTKMQLTKKEGLILKRLRNILDKSEKRVFKEIDDIDKELKN